MQFTHFYSGRINVSIKEILRFIHAIYTSTCQQWFSFWHLICISWLPFLTLLTKWDWKRNLSILLKYPIERISMYDWFHWLKQPQVNYIWCTLQYIHRAGIRGLFPTSVITFNLCCQLICAAVNDFITLCESKTSKCLPSNGFVVNTLG